MPKAAKLRMKIEKNEPFGRERPKNICRVSSLWQHNITKPIGNQKLLYRRYFYQENNLSGSIYDRQGYTLGSTPIRNNKLQL